MKRKGPGVDPPPRACVPRVLGFIVKVVGLLEDPANRGIIAWGRGGKSIVILEVRWLVFFSCLVWQQGWQRPTC